MALNQESKYITDDLKFLIDGVHVCKQYYNIALKSTNDECASKVATEKVIYALGWKVDELTCLTQIGCKLFVEITLLQENLVDKDADFVSSNIPHRLGKTKAELTPSKVPHKRIKTTIGRGVQNYCEISVI